MAAGAGLFVERHSPARLEFMTVAAGKAEILEMHAMVERTEVALDGSRIEPRMTVGAFSAGLRVMATVAARSAEAQHLTLRTLLVGSMAIGALKLRVDQVPPMGEGA